MRGFAATAANPRSLQRSGIPGLQSLRNFTTGNRGFAAQTANPRYRTTDRYSDRDFVLDYKILEFCNRVQNPDRCSDR